MNIFIKVIEKLRKVLKSLGKKEKNLINFIIFLKNLKNNNKSNFLYDDSMLRNNKDFFKKNNIWPKKIATCIIFSYNPNRFFFYLKYVRQ